MATKTKPATGKSSAPTVRKPPKDSAPETTKSESVAPKPAETTTVATPRHWHTHRDDDNIHWLTLDRSDASTNTLSKDVLAALDEVLNDLDRDAPSGLIIRSGKKNGFIAGADVSEFRRLKDPGDVEQLVLRGHAVLNRIEKLPFPTVALINGFCLGGGLELALACRYRIAGDDARLGLPEVRLGIHPGLGGTARLTRLIPAPTAMGLMLTGRSLRARAAKRMGIVDAVTQPRHFERAAKVAISGKLRVKRRRLSVAVSNLLPVRWALSPVMRAQVRKKVRPEHYPAPFALIDLWVRHGDFRDRMMRQEARSIAELITGTTAQNLVRVFFLSERLKDLGKASDKPFGHVHVIGAGTMGGDIAAWCAMRGLRVTLQDRGAEFIAPAMGRAAKLFKRRLKERAESRAAMDRLIPDIDGHGIRHADVIIEAIPEDLELKHALYRSLEPQMKPGALLATNTSSIPLEDLATVLKKPGRLIGLHFFNPVAQMPLLEVVRGENSDTAAIDDGLAFARQIDKLPLPVRSVPGFLVNRVLTPYLLAAVDLLDEGNAPAAIDAAAEAFGMPMGPLELADAVGLDICLHVGQILAGGDEWEPPAALKRLVEKGDLGKKTGRGFYQYRKGKPIKPKQGGASAAGDLQDRLILPLLDTCIACWREKIVEDADLLDAGLIFGAGFAPFRGGPIQYLQSGDAAALHRKWADIVEKSESRTVPDPGWQNLVRV